MNPRTPWPTSWRCSIAAAPGIGAAATDGAGCPGDGAGLRVAPRPSEYRVQGVPDLPPRRGRPGGALARTDGERDPGGGPAPTHRAEEDEPRAMRVISKWRGCWATRESSCWRRAARGTSWRWSRRTPFSRGNLPRRARCWPSVEAGLKPSRRLSTPSAALIRANEQRLRRYLAAADAWATRWPWLKPRSPACPSAAPMRWSRLEPPSSCLSSLRRRLVITERDEFLSEEDLDLRTMTEAELYAYWDMWLRHPDYEQPRPPRVFPRECRPPQRRASSRRNAGKTNKRSPWTAGAPRARL